jgi:glycerophosphoryl diester phosphodiesterase
MNRSQLRRLAKNYATGRLAHDEYVRLRDELIDGIVAGEIVIESSPAQTGDFTVAQRSDRSIRSSPLPLIIGACVVIAIIWAFLASRDPMMPGAGDQTDTRQLPGRRVSAARILVEEFLTTRDWSRENLAEFRDNWNALTPNEQAEARAASWFRRLSEALREEINAHKALAEFDGSGLSTTTGKRLAGFGEFLGIDSEMPDPSPPERPRVAPMEEKTALTGSQWLAAQRDDDFTLQLFAVDHLDRLDSLTAEHPSVALYLLTAEGRGPRFRLVHGSFPGEEQARLAHQALPAALRGQGQEPFIRRISDLREELRTGAGKDSASNAIPAVDPAIAYTLQVFASASRENVDRLVSRYQSLDLRIHISDGDATRYRVLYGRFDSPQAAQEASAKLPASMLEQVGKPLLRETSEFP